MEAAAALGDDIPAAAGYLRAAGEHPAHAVFFKRRDKVRHRCEVQRPQGYLHIHRGVERAGEG
ncbi:hypothetical protein SDC9_86453 [bioreactor metagenome]|uniref:Uncharacterized protein n=1 Tax=bioreactor metagenome TaxID=1076179 RepID=A0A644ZGG9_9ZZZZ